VKVVVCVSLKAGRAPEETKYFMDFNLFSSHEALPKVPSSSFTDDPAGAA
jgi:hypothetical protein